MAQSSIFTGSVSTLHDSTKLIRCPTYPHGAIVNSVPRLRRCDPILSSTQLNPINDRIGQNQTHNLSHDHRHGSFRVVTSIVRTIKDTMRLLRFHLPAGVSVLPPPEQVQRRRQHGSGQHGGDQPGPIRGEHWGHVTWSPPITAHLWRLWNHQPAVRSVQPRERRLPATNHAGGGASI